MSAPAPWSWTCSSLPCIEVPIIAAARERPQISALHGDLQYVETVFGRRHAFRIKANQVLRAQLAQNIRKRAVEFRSQSRRKDPAAGSCRECRQRILAADIAPRIVCDRHHQ